MKLLFEVLIRAILESFGLGGLAYAGCVVVAFAFAIPVTCGFLAVGFWYMEWDFIRSYPLLLIPILGYPLVVNGWRGWSVLKAALVASLLIVGIVWSLALIGNVLSTVFLSEEWPEGFTPNSIGAFVAVAPLAFIFGFLGLSPPCMIVALLRRAARATIVWARARA